MRVARIAAVAFTIGALGCSAFGTATAGAAKAPLLMRFESNKAPVGNSALELFLPGYYVVTSKLGSSTCRTSFPSATDTLNDNTVNELTLGGAGESGSCGKFSNEAMPFTQNVSMTLDTFPLGHTLGKIVIKQKGKSTTSGSVELLPDTSVNDLVSFSAPEGETGHECRYGFSKKLKGTWSGGPGGAAELLFENKWKLAGSDNEDACPKTITIKDAFTIVKAGTDETVELIVV